MNFMQSLRVQLKQLLIYNKFVGIASQEFNKNNLLVVIPTNLPAVGRSGNPFYLAIVSWIPVFTGMTLKVSSFQFERDDSSVSHHPLEVFQPFQVLWNF